MTYNASIPQPTDLISNSQPQLLANFSQLNSQFAIDHTGFNTGSGNGDGFHKKVTFNVPQGSDPVMTGTQSTFYSKAVSGVAQAFFANSAGVQQLSSATTVLGSLTGVQLPGGLKIVYSAVVSINTTATVFALPFTFTTAPAVTILAQSSLGTTKTFSATSTTTQITALVSGSTTNAYIIAIGI